MSEDAFPATSAPDSDSSPEGHPADSRERFRKLLEKRSDLLQPGSISVELQTLSWEVVPPELYRYRTCSLRTLNELGADVLPFSAPSTFDDDREDAYVPMDVSRVAKISDLATGPLLPWISRMKDKSPEEISRELSEAFWGEERSDLFSGVVFPNNGESNRDLSSVSDAEVRQMLDGICRQVVSQADIIDARNSLRDYARVACLCENPDSAYMWDRYGGNGCGFQICYSRDELFGLGGISSTLPIIFPVIYEDSRPDLGDLAALIVMQRLGAVLTPGIYPIQEYKFLCQLTALYVKNRWRFSREEEWRVVLPEPIFNDFKSNFTVRKCHCKYIRLGKDISSEDEKQLREVAESIRVPVVLYGESPE